MVFSALRALFSLGLRPGLSRPPGILPPAGNFLLAQKVPQKRLPPVALRGFPHHFRPPPKLPSVCLHRGGPGWRSAEARSASTVPFVATSKNTPHPQPFLATRNSLEKHPSLATLLGLPSPVSISEGRGTLCETWGVSAVLSAFTSCLRHEAFK